MSREIKITKTGLQAKLPGYIRTQKLQKTAAERGARIRAVRNMIKINLDDFAKILDISHGTVGRIERGSTCLSIDLANWIAQKSIENGVLVSSEWILTGKGDQPVKVTDQFSIKECFIDFMNSVFNKTNQKTVSNETIKLLSHYFFYKMNHEISSENNRETDIFFVKNDKMRPLLKKGNLVMAYEIKNIEWKDLENDICVIEYENENIICSACCIESDKLVIFFMDNSKPQVISPKRVMKIEHIIQKEIEYKFFEEVKELFQSGFLQ